MTLHIISAAPNRFEAIQARLTSLPATDKIVFIQDACFLLKQSSQSAKALANIAPRLHALSEDLHSRHLKDTCIEGVSQIDYDAFLALIIDCDNSQSWT